MTDALSWETTNTFEPFSSQTVWLQTCSTRQLPPFLVVWPKRILPEWLRLDQLNRPMLGPFMGLMGVCNSLDCVHSVTEERQRVTGAFSFAFCFKFAEIFAIIFDMKLKRNKQRNSKGWETRGTIDQRGRHLWRQRPGRRHRLRRGDRSDRLKNYRILPRFRLEKSPIPELLKKVRTKNVRVEEDIRDSVSRGRLWRKSFDFRVILKLMFEILFHFWHILVQIHQMRHIFSPDWCSYLSQCCQLPRRDGKT